MAGRPIPCSACMLHEQSTSGWGLSAERYLRQGDLRQASCLGEGAGLTGTITARHWRYSLCFMIACGDLRTQQGVWASAVSPFQGIFTP